MKRVTVPLELINLQDNGFHLLVEVVVFGQSFQIVLDTGASKTVLDKTTVEKFIAPADLLSSDHLSTGLGVTDMQSHIIHLPVLKIGKLKLKNFEVAVLDLSSISSAYENLCLPQVIGVLGGDILHRHQAIIDYHKLQLKLTL